MPDMSSDLKSMAQTTYVILHEILPSFQVKQKKGVAFMVRIEPTTSRATLGVRDQSHLSINFHAWSERRNHAMWQMRASAA